MARPAVQAKRRRFPKRVRALPVERQVFLDESSVRVAMSRNHTWVAHGTELINPVPMTLGKTLTLLGAIRLAGWVVLRTMFATVNADRFVIRLTWHLLPTLRPGEVLVMDDLRARDDARIAPAFRTRGVSVLYLRPYSPEINPIDAGWVPPETNRSASTRRGRPTHCIASPARPLSHHAASLHQWFTHSVV